MLTKKEIKQKDGDVDSVSVKMQLNASWIIIASLEATHVLLLWFYSHAQNVAFTTNECIEDARCEVLWDIESR